MRRLAAFLIGAGLVVSLGAHSPQLPGPSAAAATALIVGRVVDATTDTPIGNVIVALTGSALPRSISVLTDGQGRFLFRNVPKGTFTLRTTIGGTGYSPSGFLVSGSGQPIAPYLNGGFGQKRPGGLLQPFDVGDGERIGDVVIRLWKGSSIDGTVLDEAGEPLVNAVVAAAQRSSDGRLLTGPSTRTDDRGVYHFGTLVPGDYVVLVPQFQSAMPSATTDALVSSPDRQMTAKLANTLAPAPRSAGGVTVRDSTIATVVDYDTSALAPVPKGDALYVYQTTFAPSAPTAGQAATVTVRPGEERGGVNVSMQPVRAVAVSGTLTDDVGPVPQFGVRLMPREAEDGSGVIDVASTSTDARGRFTFPLVPQGAYRVAARRFTTTRFADGETSPPQTTRVSDRVGAWAQQEIAVGDRDLSGIALQLRPGVQVSGHVEFHGSGNRPPADRLRQFSIFMERLEPISRSLANPTRSAPVDANGDFVLRDVSPGRYLIAPVELPGWSQEAVSIGGRPVTDSAVAVESTDLADVTVAMTDQPAEVRGSAHNRAGPPDSDASVMLFPTDQTRWRDARASTRMFRTARVSKSGAFSLSPVLPGDYFIAAVSDESTAVFPDVRFLTAVAAVAKTIHVAVGDKQAVALTTIVVAPPKAPVPVQGEVPSAERVEHGPSVPDVIEVPDVSVTPVVIPHVHVRQSAQRLSGVLTTDEVTPRPMRHAIVTASGAEITGSRQVVTDDEGRFVFSDLPAGRYSLTAEKAGYVKTYYGSKRPGRPPGTPVAVVAGQPAPSVTIRMLRGAVITGVVRDQFGTPVASSQLTIKQPVFVNGQRRMIDAPNVPLQRVTTDDKGRYRIYGLPPGDYAVFCAGGSASYFGVRETNTADVEAVLREMRSGAAGAGSASTSPPPESRQVTMAAGYLPGVPDADNAQIITVAPGEERGGADIVTRLVRSMRVEGISVGPNGTPMPNVLVAIVNAGERTLWGSPGSIRPAPDGRFVAPPLTPGHYAFVGRAAETGEPEGAHMLYSGEVEFFVGDQDVTGVVLQFERGVSVTGTMAAPAGASAADLARVRLSLKATDTLASFATQPPVASVQADGTFRFDGIGAGQWRLGATLPPAWSLRSATLDSRDTLDGSFAVARAQPISGLTVTLTDRPTELTGRLTDASGQPTSEYSVLAFSTDRSLWTTAPRRVSGAVHLSSDGRYRITGLPPGEYFLAAIVDFDPIQLGDPSFLESLIASSARFTLGEGERKVQDFKIPGGS